MKVTSSPACTICAPAYPPTAPAPTTAILRLMIFTLVQRFRASNHIYSPRPEEARASSARAVSKDGHRQSPCIGHPSRHINASLWLALMFLRMRSMLCHRSDWFHGIGTLRPDARIADHLRPFRDVGLDPRLDLVRRQRRRLVADRLHSRPDVGRGNGARGFAVEQRDDLA